MQWSPQQEEALRRTATWMRDPKEQVWYVAGYAGTGKTTLAQHLVGGASRKWLFGAFTGKAAHVLRQKGCEDAKTLHSLIYRPNGESRESEIKKLEQKRDLMTASQETPFDEMPEEQRKRLEVLEEQLRILREENKMRFALWANSPLADLEVEGIVIDEVSMVDEQLGRDLESFGKKILVLGDPAQLPPVGAGGFYTKRRPNVMLTEVHRHARESGILQLATLVREGGDVREFTSTADCEIVWKGDRPRDEMAKMVLAADQVLVGMNLTRTKANWRHRTLLGRAGPAPEVGDRLVCLRNDHKLGLFNGSQWTVTRALCKMDDRTGILDIRSDEDENIAMTVEAWMHHFVGEEKDLKELGLGRRDLSEFDYAYAMTVHKAQGSQWNEVVLIDESTSFRSFSREWLYTGITRAARKLTVVT